MESEDTFFDLKTTHLFIPTFFMCVWNPLFIWYFAPTCSRYYTFVKTINFDKNLILLKRSGFHYLFTTFLPLFWSVFVFSKRGKSRCFRVFSLINTWYKKWPKNRSFWTPFWTLFGPHFWTPFFHNMIQRTTCEAK